MGKPTPGPWQATYADGGEDWIVHAVGTPWQLAYLRDDKRAQWPLEANARLIAAAPEGFDLIKELEESFTADGTYQQFLPAMRAYLAKARGQSPEGGR